MKIINHTNSGLTYLVTPSGAPLSSGYIQASGSVGPLTDVEVHLGKEWIRPQVYVKPTDAPGGLSGFMGRTVANGDATVSIMAEES
jgi:hypothetical protein